MTVNDAEYRVIRLLGKGKGGYSYLVTDGTAQYVLKHIHHEPCAYYTFGDKLRSELRDYETLRKLGIPMPRLLEVDTRQERIPEEMRQHDDQGEHGTHGRGNARAHDAHVQRKHEEIVAKYVEYTAEQHRLGGQRRVAVVAQKRRHQLGEQEAGHRKLDGEQIRPDQRQQGLLRAEQRQKRPVKKEESRPCPGGQSDRPDNSRRKVFVGPLFAACRLAPHGTQQHTAADAGQQAQTVDDVPDRGHHGQRRRARRPLILPHHGGVHHAVDGRDSGRCQKRWRGI